ncbi:MAG: YqiA/YcfP family alpha/beta fold hydrolase [Candidatus Thorarchaeota archaeon]
MQNIIFIHGLESSGKGFKGRLLRKVIPEIVSPDFKEFDPSLNIYDLLEIRMRELNMILSEKKPWILIGSSFGGLMASIYTLNNPNIVSKLILLAPFIVSRKLKVNRYKPVEVPVIVYHGKYDRTVPYKPAKERAQQLFANLEYRIVDDDHFLHNTVSSIDWQKIIQIT